MDGSGSGSGSNPDNTLNLSFRKLTSIPDDVWDAGFLQKLVLAGNPITIVPPLLSNLTNLKYLHLGSTDVAHLPDTSLAQLTQLVYLNVSESKLEEFPSGISALTNLNELLLSGTLISSIPPSISSLQSLTILKLRKCKITSIPEAVGELKHLKDLYLNDNNITGPIPPFIYGLSCLERLDLSANKLTALTDYSAVPEERFSEVFGGLPNLHSLVLNDNHLDLIPPNTLSNLTRLESLSLQYNHISSVPGDLCKLKLLRMLDLAVNRISVVPAEWAELPSLFSLDLSYNDISAFPSTFVNFPTLKIISVAGNNFDGLPQTCHRMMLERGVRVRYNQEDILPNEILPGLFLGGVAAARDRYHLKRLGIQSILTVAAIDPIYPDEFKYKVVKIDDHADQDITAHFDECRVFITEALKDGKVLIHCAAGISRSATVTIMYVMTVKKMNFETAFTFVKDRRPIICPNSGFREQLQKYEENLFKDERESKCVVS